jgi:tetratricopeptide (TPR) repeat protein
MVVALALLTASGAGAQDGDGLSASAEASYERGTRALRKGDIPAALEYLAVAQREAPLDASVISAYAQALVAAGRNAEAEKLLDELAARGDTSSDLAVGMVRYQLGDYDQAAVALRRAVKSDPSNARAHLFLGAALIGAGQLDEVEPQLAEAQRLDSGLAAEVAFRRGDLALARGDRAAASAAYAEAERLAPNSSLARAARSQMGEDAPDRPWSVYISTGGGYDSNVNLSGQDAEISVSGEDAWFWIYEVGGHYDAIDTDRWGLRLGGNFFGRLNGNPEVHDLNLGIVRGYAVGSMKASRNVLLDARYTYERSWTGIDYRDFRQVHAVEPSVRWRPREDLLTRVLFRAEFREYFPETPFVSKSAYPAPFDRELSNDPLDRDGKLWVPGIEQYWFMPDFSGWGRGFVRLSYRYRKEDTDGEEFDSTGSIPNLMLGLPLPWRVFLLGEGEYEWRNGDNPSVFGLISRDEFGDRRDRIWRARALLRRPITDHLTGEIGYRWTNWDSNVEFYSFDRHIGYFLVTYSY